MPPPPGFAVLSAIEVPVPVLFKFFLLKWLQTVRRRSRVSVNIDVAAVLLYTGTKKLNTS